MKFPKVITRHGHKATIYGRTSRYPKYRLCYWAEGKRLTRVFWTYGEALKSAKSTVRELAKGHAVSTTLSKADAQAYKFASGNPAFKKWVFFGPAGDCAVESGVFIEGAFFRQRPIQPHTVSHQRSFPMPSPCNVFNYYVESALHKEKQTWGATKTIEDALLQVMKGHSGLMAKL